MVGTSTPQRNARVEEVRSENGGNELNLAFPPIRPIRTDEEYESARELVARLLREPHEKGTVAYDLLEVLSILIEAYDRENVPDLNEATPQEVVQFMAEQQGMTPGDLASLMGGRSRLSEFLNGKRDLSLGQIRSLRDELGISADLLIA